MFPFLQLCRKRVSCALALHHAMQTLSCFKNATRKSRTGRSKSMHGPPLTARASHNPFSVLRNNNTKQKTVAFDSNKKWPAKNSSSSVSMQPQKITAHDNCTILNGIK